MQSSSSKNISVSKRDQEERHISYRYKRLAQGLERVFPLPGRSLSQEHLLKVDFNLRYNIDDAKYKFTLPETFLSQATPSADRQDISFTRSDRQKSKRALQNYGSYASSNALLEESLPPDAATATAAENDKFHLPKLKSVSIDTNTALSQGGAAATSKARTSANTTVKKQEQTQDKHQPFYVPYEQLGLTQKAIPKRNIAQGNLQYQTQLQRLKGKKQSASVGNLQDFMSKIRISPSQKLKPQKSEGEAQQQAIEAATVSITPQQEGTPAEPLVSEEANQLQLSSVKNELAGSVFEKDESKKKTKRRRRGRNGHTSIAQLQHYIEQRHLSSHVTVLEARKAVRQMISHERSIAAIDEQKQQIRDAIKRFLQVEKGML